MAMSSEDATVWMDFLMRTQTVTMSSHHLSLKEPMPYTGIYNMSGVPVVESEKGPAGPTRGFTVDLCQDADVFKIQAPSKA